MRFRLIVLTAAVCAVMILPVSAQRPGGPPGGAPGGGGERAGATGAEAPEGVAAVERVSTTQHTISIDGKPVAYTATAGTMVLRDANGKAKATVFYISFVEILSELSAAGAVSRG